MHFSGHLSTGPDLVINFDFVKCITETNLNSYPNYNGKLEGGLSLERENTEASARCTSLVYSTDTEVSFLMSCSLKVTQYMDQTTSQLYSIWMSVPKVLYR